MATARRERRPHGPAGLDVDRHHNGVEMVRFGSLRGLPRADLETSAAVWTGAGVITTVAELIRAGQRVHADPSRSRAAGTMIGS